MSDDRLRVVSEGADAEEELARARLAPFAASAQRYMEAELVRRSTRPVPVLRLPSRRPWIAVAVAGAVAAAAAIVLFAVPRRSVEGDAPRPTLASHSEQASPEQGSAVAVTPPPQPRAAQERSLRSLDARAQQQWRAGDLDGATRTFRQMTEQDGDHRYIELAYADLVTLARQRGKSGSVSALWREYLERFPHGRFAVDARAAVCGGPGQPAACAGDVGQASPR